MYYLAIAVVLLLGVWSLGSYLAVRNIEEPAYTVLEKKSGYEIRQYEAYITASTEVAGDYQTAMNNGFRTVAGYIFGDNTSDAKISMTAPVLEASSEKIAMTAPVLSTDTTSQSRIISFVLPSSYTMDTLPTPNNTNVLLTNVPAHAVAALRFTGYATRSRIEKKKAKLRTDLVKDNIAITGDVQVAQYNPPLSMPLLRRNEILILIEIQSN